MSRDSDKWADLQIGLTDVFDGNLEYKRFMELYSHIFNMYTLTPRDGKLQQLQEIYEKLKQLITDNVSRIFEQCENKDDLDLLSIYDKIWKSFRFNSKLVDGICAYFNREYIKKEQDKENENLYLIHELCFVIWKDAFHRTESRVTNAILDLIHQEHTESYINRDIIKDVLQSYVELNIRDDVFVECFEKKFLQTTTDYYRVTGKTIPRAECLNTIDKWVTNEARRYAYYLDPTTEPKLREIMENILIKFKRICSSEWGNVLSGGSLVRIKSYEQSNFTIVSKLSKGGQADVKLVTVPGLPVPVVAKLFADVSNKEEGFLQMKDEIRTLLATQCNPHIVSLRGYIVKEHRIKGLLLEHCKGSLDSVITSAEDYSESSIIRWSLHAACGLDSIHNSNAIHRDVNPSNMLLDESHQLLKISDLGIVKMGTIISDVLHCDYTSKCGTKGYKAPEIIDGNVDTCTPKIDVFSLGRSIWKMIFRCPPKDTLDETLSMKVAVSPTIWAYVQRMMAHDRDSRPTMAEVYTFFEGQEQPPTPTDIITQPASKIMINAPFDEKLTSFFKLTNISDHCIGWTAKISSLNSLDLDRVHGRLSSNETTRITISCDFFANVQEDINACIIIEWTGIPHDSDEQFCPEWFHDAGVVRKKKLCIEYNP